MNKIFLLCAITLVPVFLKAQNKPFVSHPDQLNDQKFAEWIIPQEDDGVFYFRKVIELESVPASFVVHVSADARYKLYVNEKQVCWGPAVGDIENWNYETVDLAPFLIKGKNIIASQVWNHGLRNGARQISLRTAFIMQGESNSLIVNTDKSWKVCKDPGYFGVSITDAIAGGGYIAGGTDSIVAEMCPWGWNMLNFDDSTWNFANEIGKGNHAGLDTWKGTMWKLKPREIPPMEQKVEKIPAILEVKGIPVPDNMGKPQFVIPADTHAEILLDNRNMTMGFPQLSISGGKGGIIKIRYQESLFDSNNLKGNRNQWQGKTMKGCYDVFVADGAERNFEPLWLRVFRYLKISIDTKAEPLTINDFYNVFTAYPLQQKASFNAQDPVLNNVWSASWRTARLCALENYMDCPYYEQLQYIGDTRIQALISMYVAGDDRLAKNAILHFYNSIQPMGLTKSVHPSKSIQIIPPFSLLYIAMIHDYYMLRDDPQFVKQFVPGIKFILEWFVDKVGPDGIMGPLPYWNHIDGGTSFVNGSPPGISEGGSAHMTILLAYAMDRAIRILDDFGYSCDADRYRQLSKSLKSKTMELCYCNNRKLIAETPAKDKFSQHTNIFAVLTDTYDPQVQPSVVRNIIDDQSLIQTTLYFKFYLFQALKKTGLGGEVLGLMNVWKTFLDSGFTTFPEHGINSRSDCHAWSAHPMYDFLNITLGIASSSPGFKTVEIKPETGFLSDVNGSIPHPLGNISCVYKKNGKSMEYIIKLPEKLTGTLIYDNINYTLKPGDNIYKFK